jgi:hypothetical protein
MIGIMMSNRIEELIHESKISVIATKGHEYINDGCYIVSPDRVKEFAEMIIKECSNIAYSRPLDIGPEIGSRIKKHFGVN